MSMLQSGLKVQIDFWESHLGNSEWDWNNIASYIRQNEQARPLTRKQIEASRFFDPDCHGHNRELHVGPRDDGSQYSPLIQKLMEIAKRHGAPT